MLVEELWGPEYKAEPAVPLNDDVNKHQGVLSRCGQISEDFFPGDCLRKWQDFSGRVKLIRSGLEAKQGEG